MAAMPELSDEPYRLLLPALGVPAASADHGGLGWSSTALLVGQRTAVVVDTGGPGYRACWDGWLAAAGLARGDVGHVLLTHAHWDHIGASTWFPRATVCIGREELPWANGAADRDPHLHRGLVEELRRHPRLRLLEAGDVVAGLLVLPTPGHTPGHVSYVVSTDDGPLVVVGDAIKNRVELRAGAFAMTLDQARSEASWRRLRRLARQGYRLLLGHDGLFGADPTAPMAAPAARIRVAQPGVQVTVTT